MRHRARQHVRGAGRRCARRSATRVRHRIGVLRRHLPPLLRGIRSGRRLRRGVAAVGGRRSASSTSAASISTTRRRRSPRAATVTSSSRRGRSARSRSAASCAIRGSPASPRCSRHRRATTRSPRTVACCDAFAPTPGPRPCALTRLTGRSHLLPMPRYILLLALLLAGAAPRASAPRPSITRGSAPLARPICCTTRSLTEMTVRQSIAPMLALGALAAHRAERGYRANLEATFASGKFHRNEAGSKTASAPSAPATLMLGLEGPRLRSIVRWRAGLGGHPVLSGREARASSSRAERRDFSPAAASIIATRCCPNWDLMTSRGTISTVSRTDTLAARGFSQSQGVSRVSLSIGLSRGIR